MNIRKQACGLYFRPTFLIYTRITTARRYNNIRPICIVIELANAVGHINIISGGIWA